MEHQNELKLINMIDVEVTEVKWLWNPVTPLLKISTIEPFISHVGFGYELIEKETNYRVIGKNSVPTHVEISSLEDATRVLHKQKEVKLFAENAQSLLRSW